MPKERRGQGPQKEWESLQRGDHGEDHFPLQKMGRKKKVRLVGRGREQKTYFRIGKGKGEALLLNKTEAKRNFRLALAKKGEGKLWRRGHCIQPSSRAKGKKEGQASSAWQTLELGKKTTREGKKRWIQVRTKGKGGKQTSGEPIIKGESLHLPPQREKGKKGPILENDKRKGNLTSLKDHGDLEKCYGGKGGEKKVNCQSVQGEA